MIITGDNMLTAISVANSVDLNLYEGKERKALILDYIDEKL